MRPTFIDSHCHLEPDDFRTAGGDDERAMVVARAKEAGVTRLIVIGSGHGAAEIDNAFLMADRYPEVVAGVAIGIHPHDAGRASEELLAAVENRAAEPRALCIGETGLDYHYKNSTPAEQEAVFRRFLRLCSKLQKPVSLHIRSDEKAGPAGDAHRDALRIVKEECGGALQKGGVVHCFTGNAAEARAWLDLGFHISLSGIVTFKNAEAIREAARLVPADRLLLETDSPYLAPVPRRGQRNEPAFLVHTAERVAEVRGTSLSRLAEETRAATERLFGLTY